MELFSIRIQRTFQLVSTSEHRIIYSVHDDIVTNILNFYEISL